MKNKKLKNRIKMKSSLSELDVVPQTNVNQNSNPEEFEDPDPGLMKALAFFVDFNKQYKQAEEERRLPDFMNETMNFNLLIDILNNQSN